MDIYVYLVFRESILQHCLVALLIKNLDWSRTRKLKNSFKTEKRNGKSPTANVAEVDGKVPAKEEHSEWEDYGNRGSPHDSRCSALSFRLCAFYFKKISSSVDEQCHQSKGGGGGTVAGVVESGEWVAGVRRRVAD